MIAKCFDNHAVVFSGGTKEDDSLSHVGHVQLQQYGFRARLIFTFVLCLFLLQALLDQSKTSTEQKMKKPSVTLHMICGNNNSLSREMSAQMKHVE